MRATGKTRFAVAVSATLIAGMLASSPTQASPARAGGWSPPQLIDPVFVPHAVSCSGQSSCMIVGGGAVRSFSGHAWSSPTTIDPNPGAQGLTSISCPTANFCAGVDSAGNAILYRGSWGSPQKIDPAGGLTSVSCSSENFCVAVDSAGNAIAYQGSWGSPKTIDAGDHLVSVSCPAQDFCAAVSSAGNALMYQGGWGAAKKIDAGGHVTSVSCASRLFCAAVDRAGHRISYVGGAWTGPRRSTRRAGV